MNPVLLTVIGYLVAVAGLFGVGYLVERRARKRDPGRATASDAERFSFDRKLAEGPLPDGFARPAAAATREPDSFRGAESARLAESARSAREGLSHRTADSPD
jgi:hypothetical protein